MAKISEYLRTRQDRPSSARLMMYSGLWMSFACCLATVICWIWSKDAPNKWIACIDAIPGFVGIIPYCILTWRENSEKIESLVKAFKKGDKGDA